MAEAGPDFRELGRRLSNWGRWDVDGVKDERGTTNLLTPERVAAAAAPVRDGKVFDLGIATLPNRSTSPLEEQGSVNFSDHCGGLRGRPGVEAEPPSHAVVADQRGHLVDVSDGELA
jgi:hypothetical protein